MDKGQNEEDVILSSHKPKIWDKMSDVSSAWQVGDFWPIGHKNKSCDPK